MVSQQYEQPTEHVATGATVFGHALSSVIPVARPMDEVDVGDGGDDVPLVVIAGQSMCLGSSRTVLHREGKKWFKVETCHGFQISLSMLVPRKADRTGADPLAPRSHVTDTEVRAWIDEGVSDAAIQDRFDALLPHCAARGMHVAMLDVMPRPTSVPSKDPKSYVALKASSAVSSGAMGVGDAVHDYVVRPVASLVGISLERSTGPSDAAAPVANRTGGDQPGSAKQQRAVSITPPRSMDGLGRQFGAYVLGMRLASRDCWRISVDRSAARESSRNFGIEVAPRGRLDRWSDPDKKYEGFPLHTKAVLRIRDAINRVSKRIDALADDIKKPPPRA